MSVETSAKQYNSLLVISDTHLGLPDDRVFREDFENFVDFLARNPVLQIESEAGGFQTNVPKVIILLGDFVDLWDGHLEKLPALSTSITRSLTKLADVFYLRGNHDYVVPDMQPRVEPGLNIFEICEYKVLNISGKPYFFIHGHQFMSAFGPTALKIESYINPYYTTLESFFSRFTHGHGILVMRLLTLAWLILSIVLARFQPLPSSISEFAVPLLWATFGLLLVPSIATIWRLTQKIIWKCIVVILEKVGFLLGASRGDTITFLTEKGRPITRWFSGKDGRVVSARASKFVVFGHTHIPEGPLLGVDRDLRGITFLNTGSWVRLQSKRTLALIEIIRKFTKPFDTVDEYVLFPMIAAVILAFFRPEILPVISPIAVFLGAVVFSAVESLVAVGRSSPRRVAKARVRSLAFIGNDDNGVRREVLVYWDPVRRVLST